MDLNNKDGATYEIGGGSWGTTTAALSVKNNRRIRTPPNQQQPPDAGPPPGDYVVARPEHDDEVAALVASAAADDDAADNENENQNDDDDDDYDEQLDNDDDDEDDAGGGGGGGGGAGGGGRRKSGKKKDCGGGGGRGSRGIRMSPSAAVVVVGTGSGAAGGGRGRTGSSSCIGRYDGEAAEATAPPFGAWRHHRWLWTILALAVGRNFCQSGVSSITAVYFKDWLGLSESQASAFTNTALALTYGSGLIGGASADTFAGHFSVISVGCMIMLLSTLALFAASCLFGAEGTAMLIVSIAGFLCLSLAGVMGPSLSALVGDQFHPTQTKQRSSAYSWYYLAVQVGGLPAAILLPLLLDALQPWCAFMTALVVFMIAVPIFFLPSRNLKKEPPTRGTYVVVWKVFVAAFKKAKCSWRLCCLKGRNRSCLDAAKQEYDGSKVEDVKSALNVLSVFLVMPFFWGVFFQISSLWVFQAADMDCTFGNWTLPYAEVGCLNNLADIVLIPLFDQLLYPALTYIRIAVTPLRKMISGFVVTCIASCVAGLVQIAMENNPEEPISVLLILPQYILISMAEILLSVTAYEFAYTESPKTMRGFITAIWLATIALGNLITALLALLPLTQSTMSFVLAGITIVVMAVFCLIVWRYNKHKTTLPSGAPACLDQ